MIRENKGGEKASFRTKNMQEYLDKTARQLFNDLLKELEEPGKTEISLDKLRGVMSMYSNKANLKDDVIQIIFKYHLPQLLLKNEIKDKGYDIKLNEQAFCDFFTGKEMKNILFNKNLDNKRNEVEELQNLYKLMGGNKDGISLETLNKDLTKALKLHLDPGTYLKESYDPSREDLAWNGEAKEIIDLLSRSKNNGISLEDFVNVMTSEIMIDFDEINIDSQIH
jgi:hypothetical protein